MNAVLRAPQPQPTRRLFTADEYYDMARRGYFDEQRVELIGGVILLMSEQSNYHALGITFMAQELMRVFGPNHWVRIQMSLDLSPMSVPDPDIAVIAGAPISFLGKRHNPTSALLIVEVSETTLTSDRNRKASLYAASGIADYWILNIDDKQIEVHRDPQPDSSQEFGFGYASVTIHGAGDSVSPLSAPSERVAVLDVLPNP
jgi:Uma2 family endonuclease